MAQWSGLRVKPGSLVGHLKTAQLEKLHNSLLNKRIHARHAQEIQQQTTNKSASNRWVVDGLLDGKTEVDIVAAQDGVTHLTKYLVTVTGQSGPVTCRACGGAIGHVLTACGTQLFHLIKWRHDRVLLPPCPSSIAGARTELA